MRCWESCWTACTRRQACCWGWTSSSSKPCEGAALAKHGNAFAVPTLLQDCWACQRCCLVRLLPPSKIVVRLMTACPLAKELENCMASLSLLPDLYCLHTVHQCVPSTASSWRF
jgi:hypothetical protein